MSVSDPSCKNIWGQSRGGKRIQGKKAFRRKMKAISSLGACGDEWKGIEAEAPENEKDLLSIKLVIFET